MSTTVQRCSNSPNNHSSTTRSLPLLLALEDDVGLLLWGLLLGGVALVVGLLGEAVVDEGAVVDALLRAPRLREQREWMKLSRCLNVVREGW